VCGDFALAVWLDLFVVYPDGRYPGRWGRPLALLGYMSGVVVATITLLHGSLTVTGSSRPVPPAADSWLPQRVHDTVDHLPVLDSAMFLVLPVALVAMLVRYSSAGDDERRQIRWPLAAIGLIATLVVVAQTGIQPADWGNSDRASVAWGLLLTT